MLPTDWAKSSGQVELLGSWAHGVGCPLGRPRLTGRAAAPARSCLLGGEAHVAISLSGTPVQAFARNLGCPSGVRHVGIGGQARAARGRSPGHSAGLSASTRQCRYLLGAATTPPAPETGTSLGDAALWGPCLSHRWRLRHFSRAWPTIPSCLRQTRSRSRVEREGEAAGRSVAPSGAGRHGRPHLISPPHAPRGRGPARGEGFWGALVFFKSICFLKSQLWTQHPDKP